LDGLWRPLRSFWRGRHLGWRARRRHQRQRRSAPCTELGVERSEDLAATARDSDSVSHGL